MERWQRTGVLQLFVAAVVFATWIYFQVRFPAADRPLVLNDILLMSVSWLGLKVALSSGQKIGEKEEKHKAEEKSETDSSSPESEPEDRGRHAK